MKHTHIFHAIDETGIMPHYFNITGKKLNILISYYYLDGQAYTLTHKYRDQIGLLYLDSGAFSAHTKNVKISLPEFRRYIRRYDQHFDGIFSLDDNFDNPDENFNNQVYLEEGLPEGTKRPIPVIHDEDDPMGEFAMYVDQGHTYIAIGSNRTRHRKLLEDITANHSDINIHLFGTLNLKLLTEFKPYSADATTWAHATGTGNIMYWDSNENQSHKVYVGARDKTGKKGEGITHYNKFELKDDLDKFLDEKFGYTRVDLFDNTIALRIVNLYFFQQVENHINSL